MRAGTAARSCPRCVHCSLRRGVTRSGTSPTWTCSSPVTPSCCTPTTRGQVGLSSNISRLICTLRSANKLHTLAYDLANDRVEILKARATTTMSAMPAARVATSFAATSAPPPSTSAATRRPSRKMTFRWYDILKILELALTWHFSING